MGNYLNAEVLCSSLKERFEQATPFRWLGLSGFLTDDGFSELCESFPPLELFERHDGIKRGYGQRPHDRWYLAFAESIYHGTPGKGAVDAGRLPAPWRDFITELEGTDYRRLAGDLLGLVGVEVRYAWHVGTAGSEVSPHVDAVDKAGTHIFYFNEADRWDPAWGGSMLVLGERTTDSRSPDFSDFAHVTEVDTVGNRSFVFRNEPEAWHGVRSLTCPPGAGRRLFNVIFEFPGTSTNRIVSASDLDALPRRRWWRRLHPRR